MLRYWLAAVVLQPAAIAQDPMVEGTADTAADVMAAAEAVADALAQDADAVAADAIAAIEESSTASSATTACEHSDYSAFDFWVGEWDVFPTGDDTMVADSLIERMAGGCVIRETWMPLKGAGGTSLTNLNHRTNRWQQVWVGSDGRRVDFEGGVVDGRMVLTGYWDDIGGPGRDGLIRMTFTALPDGSVRQFGEASGSHGLDWVTSFDFTYRRKDSANSGDE